MFDFNHALADINIVLCKKANSGPRMGDYFPKTPVWGELAEKDSWIWGLPPTLRTRKQQIVFDSLPNDQSNFVSVKHVSLPEGVADIGDLCVYSRPEIWPHWSEIPKTRPTDLLR